MKNKKRKALFSKREVHVLELLWQEKNNKTISKNLKISVDTVRFHRKNLYKKAKVKTLLGLIKFALNKKILKISSFKS